MPPLARVQDLFSASRKITLTKATFIAYIVPPLACLYLMGVLVQLKGTRFYRLALLPVVAWSAWRSMFVDMSRGDAKQAQMNTVLVTHMCFVCMRCTGWAMLRDPLQRRNSSNKFNKSGIRTALWNSWDLMFNTRGIGWSWSRRLDLPKPAFKTDSRVVFVLASALQSAFHALCFDACLQTMRMLSPHSFGSLAGGSLFDHTLPPLLGLLRALFASLLAIWIAYFAIQWSYHFVAMLCVIVFQQHPSQWPPLFDSPWLSTSLSELWGRRWHQMMREVLLTLGFRPSSCLFGRIAGPFGAFLVSGLFHDIELRSFGRGGNSVVIVGFWVMNGVGVVLERVWTRVTRRRVCGVWGRIWTIGWLALWGVSVVDAWAKVGRFGALSLPGEIEPSLALVAFVRRCTSSVMP